MDTFFLSYCFTLNIESSVIQQDAVISRSALLYCFSHYKKFIKFQRKIFTIDFKHADYNLYVKQDNCNEKNGLSLLKLISRIQSSKNI